MSKKSGEYYSPPEKQGCMKFLWDSETSQCLGRTGGSWAKILCFYVIFYSALSGFFAAIFAVFYQTLEMDKPKWLLDNGLIGNNPGLGFRPMPSEDHVESTLIWYNKNQDYSYWTKEIKKFLEEYKTHSDNVKDKKTQVDCSFQRPPQPGQVCRVDFNEVFERCTEEYDYGFSKGTPCIFLKLNKIYGWMPDIYNDSKSLPGHMPEGLVSHITERANFRPNETNLVWVSCEGENPADRENIRAINYYPQMGFPAFYFPYTNVQGYIPPLVAVQFDVGTGVLINIECKAWARNIVHDRAERRGSVHFELMID